MNQFVRFRFLIGYSLVAILAIFVAPVVTGAPDPPPPCTDSSPHYSSWCIQQGSFVTPVQPTWTNKIALLGSAIAPPSLIGPVFNPGKQGTWIRYVCDWNAYLSYYVTNDVFYESNIGFSPAFPATAATLGTNSYNMYVTGQCPGSECSIITATFNLTIKVFGKNDSDYDGIGDYQEVLNGTDPYNASSISLVRLGYWPFDNTNTWIGSSGQSPIAVTNLSGTPSWKTNAVVIDSTNSSVLAYSEAETNGNANINLKIGTVRFWFKPNWTSVDQGGTGSQNEGRLIEVGAKGSTNGWWGLLINSSGTNIYFGTQTNSPSTLTTNLVVPISWVAGIWHQLVLAYNSTNTSLYIDGQLAGTNGSGVVCYPGLAVRTNGFTVGSSFSGTNQARGTFDELETFNYLLNATNILTDYQDSVALLIIAQPTNQTVLVCDNATFGVTAIGTALLHYQWFARNPTNTVALLGKTGTTLSLENVQAANANSYFVVVSNIYGSITSSNAVLTVLEPPLISFQPTNQVVNIGSSASFSVTAGGTMPLSYQWYGIGSAVLLAATNPVLSFASVQTNNADAYYVVVTNAFGSTTSLVATLTVLNPPLITTQPSNQIVILSGSATFNVMVNGGDPMYYQWYKVGSGLLTGAISPTLNLTNIQSSDIASYYVMITNIFGAVTSSNVLLTLDVPPSVSITNPLYNSVYFANPTNLSLAATASDPDGTISQIQFFQGTNILGVVSSPPYTLIWSNVPAGGYVLTAVAADNLGLTATSVVVNLSIFTTNNLRLWLKADAIIGLTNTAQVSAWPDSSGWTNNATQSSAVNRPRYVTNVINGYPSIYFNGANNFANNTNSILNLPNFMNGATQGEAFVVLEANAGNVYNRPQPLWYMGGYNNTTGGYPAADGSIQDGFGSQTPSVAPYNLGIPLQSLTQFHIYEASSQSNNWAAWINGVLQYQTTNNAVGFTASPKLGGSYYYFGGNIAEVLVFNRVLTNSERLTVNAYLNGKYGLVPAMPATPTNLVATTISSTQIGLTWDEVMNGGATQIAIERCEASNGNYQVVAQIQNANFYLDTNLATNTAYYYRVRAINISQWSDYSGTAQAVTFASGSDLPVDNLKLWLKADAITGLTNNAQVNIWYDSSGQNNNATQTTPSYQPVYVTNALNGLPAVQFSGAQHSMFNLPSFMAGATQGEAFVVLKASSTNPGDQRPLWYMGGYNGTAGGYPETTGRISDGFGSANLNTFYPSQSFTQFHIYQVSSQTNNWQAWINGISQYQATNNQVAFPPVGASYPYGPVTLGGSWVRGFAGTIAEVLVFNRVLTNSERLTVNAYLNGKYGLVPAMPATPTNLVATTISPTQIGLTWDEVMNGWTTRVVIERSTASNGTYTVMAQIIAATSYVDTNLTANTTYYYRVRAINISQWSDYSGTVQATTLNAGGELPFGSLILWLKADAGFSQGSNTAAISWIDQSGKGNNAFQTSGGNQPAWVPGVIGDRPVVRFDGTSSYFNLPNILNGTTAAEAFVVLKCGTNMPSVRKPLWRMGRNNSDTSFGFPDTDGHLRDDFGTYNHYDLGLPSQPVTLYSIYNVVAQTGNWAAWLNGTMLYQTNNNAYQTNAAPTLGGDGGWHTYFYGDIAEVLIFSRAVTYAERATVNGYLNTKYCSIVPAPVDIVATAISQTQTLLNWNDAGASQFSVERSLTNNGGFSLVAQISNTVEYVDNGLTNGTTYYYRIQAHNYLYTSPHSSYSSVVQATTLTNGILPFSPVFWLRADLGITTNASSHLSVWTNQSGLGGNAIQSINDSQPTWVPSIVNSNPVVRFDGTNNYLNLPNFLTGTKAAEVFVVMKVATNSPGSRKSLWEMGGDAWDEKAYPNTDGSINDDFGSTTIQHAGVPIQALDQYHVYEVSSQSNNWSSWVNGTLLAHTDNNTVSFSAGLTLGQAPYAFYGTSWFWANSYFAGDIAEVVIYNQALTVSERRVVNRYLNAKYGLVPPVPTTPTNLAAMAVAPTQIALTWDAALDGAATQIGIQRSVTSNGVFQLVAQIPGATSYMDTNLTPGMTYYYQVAAINLTQWSPTSNVAQATTPMTGTNLPLDSLALWLKADAGLLQNSTNLPINQWLDQSGNENNATQLDKAKQPVWVPGIVGCRPAIRFNGSNAFFGLRNFMSGVTGAEAFVVLKVATNDLTGRHSLWEMGGDVWSGKAYPGADRSINDDFGSGGGSSHNGAHGSGSLSQPLNEYHIYNVAAQASNWRSWITGTLIAQTGDNILNFSAAPGLGISAYAEFTVWWTTFYSYFSGDIAEVLIFKRALTADERTAVGIYLNGKYALVPAVPATPTNLMATAISSGQVSLSWDETLNGGATRISIERMTVGSWTYQTVGQTSAGNSYVDTNLVPGTTYYYRVRAINVVQWSDYSGVAQVTTPTVGLGLPVTGLRLWLKADAGLLQGSTNTRINMWEDQSGYGNHATQPTAAYQPVWTPGIGGNRPSVQFNGTNSYFQLPTFLNGASAAEAFVVLKVAATNSYHSLWELGGDSWDSKAYSDIDGSIRDDFGSALAHSEGIPATLLTQYHVYEVLSQNDNWASWINGTLLFQTSETDNNSVSFDKGMSLGSAPYAFDDPDAPFILNLNSYFAGNISEILIYNRALTPGERLAVNGYLKRKYRLESAVVAITSPGNYAVVVGATNIAISATASNSAGIKQVQFLQGATSLGIVTNVPYSLVWSNVALGGYALAACATDNNGQTYTSTVVNVTVAGISITSPTNNSVLPAPANISVSATAVDGAGIKQVQFFRGTTSLGIVTNIPYNLVWSNAASGTYTLTACATDNTGLVLTSAVVNVTVDTPPSVTLTSPTNNARFVSGSNISLGATASDADGAIATVEFFASTNSLGVVASSPYNLVWSNAPSGAYTLTARATDNNGLNSTSAVANIMIVGINITGPANNVVLTAPASISISATVTDNLGVNQVEFFQGTTSLGTVISAPYNLAWNGVTAGAYAVTARATDAGGLVFNSDILSVIVDTDPNNTDRDGDGVSDYLEYLQGRNPLVNGAVPDTNNALHLQVYTPLR